MLRIALAQLLIAWTPIRVLPEVGLCDRWHHPGRKRHRQARYYDGEAAPITKLIAVLVQRWQHEPQGHRHIMSVGGEVTIFLRDVTRDNWRETLQLSVFAGQQRFVADHAPIAAIALAKAFVRPEGLVWVPYAIYADVHMVGLIELAYESGSCDEYWIYHFFIDHAHQRKGYGKAALRAFVEMVKEKHPAAERVQLAVHPENTHAQHLYTGFQFQPTGKELGGEPVYMLQL